MSIERCGSELVYAPGSSVRCEMPHDHTGIHAAGEYEWRVGDNESEPRARTFTEELDAAYAKATEEVVSHTPATLIRQMALNLHYLEHDPARNNFVTCPRGWCAYARAWLEANKRHEWQHE